MIYLVSRPLEVGLLVTCINGPTLAQVVVLTWIKIILLDDKALLTKVKIAFQRQ